MKGCTFPGRMISCAGAVRFGGTTDDRGDSHLHSLGSQVCAEPHADTIPEIRRPATNSAAMARANQSCALFALAGRMIRYLRILTGELFRRLQFEAPSW